MNADNQNNNPVPAAPPSSSEDPLVTREKFNSPEPITEGEPPAEISLANLDALINESDPDFAKQMSELEQIVVDASETLHLVNTTAITDAQDGRATSHSKIPGLDRLRHIIHSTDPGDGSPKAPIVQRVRFEVQSALKDLNRRQWKRLMLALSVIFVMGILSFALRPTLDGLMKEEFFGGYDMVADSIVPYTKEMKMVPFHDPLEDFNFIVQYERMISNLKPSQNSTSNPMVTFVIYVEGSSRETAVELKDREMEVRDICQRVAEGLSYDEFISAEGKKRFKNLVRRQVNQILNEGHLKAIYFDTVIVKP